MDATLSWERQVLDQAIPELPVSPRETTDPYNGPGIALEEFLARVEILGKAADEFGKKLAIVCPWISEQSGGDRTGTYVGHHSDGGLWFRCHYQHCQDRRWKELKKKTLPGFRLKITRPGYTGNMEVSVRHG